MKKICKGLFAVIALMTAGVAATAQNYPTHPITMIVPYPAGGPSDVVARIMADGMSKVLGQNIVIENVGGAGGTIGTARAAGSEHDGYTVLSRQHGITCVGPSALCQLEIRLD